MARGLMKKSQRGELYEKAREVAEYYGFSSLANTFGSLPARKRGEGGKPKINPPREGIAGEADRLSIISAYINYNLILLPQPVLIYHSEPLGKSMDREAYGGKDAVQFSLEIIGTGKSAAEAILFKTTSAILKEVGFENISVTVNSLGDRESIARFSRDFLSYYRKNLNEVPSHCRGNLRKDVFKVLECANEKCMLIKEKAPKPIGSLSEESRVHFSEILEYLESMGLPYRINNCLVGGKEFYTKTIFEFRSEDPENKLYPKALFEAVLGKGGRYDDLGKRLGYKREVPAVGISLSFGGLGLTMPHKRRDKIRSKKNKAYLIQLGFEAKLQSLVALEILRKARVPVCQSLSKDHLASQIAAAEKMNIPYIIIIGQKEALEGTAIVRNMFTRSQETMLLGKLPTYLK